MAPADPRVNLNCLFEAAPHSRMTAIDLPGPCPVQVVRQVCAPGPGDRATATPSDRPAVVGPGNHVAEHVE
jgi:hypothetical protein